VFEDSTFGIAHLTPQGTQDAERTRFLALALFFGNATFLYKGSLV
jgi:hypothetical protein